MDINSMLEPRQAFSRTPYPEYTQAQIDAYYAHYQVYPPQPYQIVKDDPAQLTPSKQRKFENKITKAAKILHEDFFEFDTRRPTFGRQAAIKQAGSMYNSLKDAGAPTPPRWTGTLGVSRDKLSTDVKGSNLVQGDAPWVQDYWASIKQEYNKAIIQPSGTKGLLVPPPPGTKGLLVPPPPGTEWLSVPPPHPISATERRDNGHTSFEASPKVYRMSPAERNQRAAQLIAVRRQELGMTIQNPIAGRNRARSSRFRELMDMQKGQAPFVDHLPNFKEGIIGNDRSVLDQHNTLLQRPTTPPLARFNKPVNTDSRKSSVSGPPALLPRQDSRSTAMGQAPFVNLLTAQQQQQANRASGPPSLRSSPEQTEPGGLRRSAVMAHQQAQHHHQMSVQQQSFMMQQFQAVGQDAVVAQQAHQDPGKDNPNGLPASPSSLYPEWGFGRDSNMLPSPLTFQTPVDPNGPSFARDNSAERKRKTSDQRNMPVQPNDERCVSPRTFKNTRIFCSVYSLPQGKVQSTISEDHTTNVSKRRKLNFMALGQSKSYGATTKQHSRRDAEPNGRMSALIRA